MFQHVRVVPVHTGTFETDTRGAGGSSVLLTKICPRKVITCLRGSRKNPRWILPISSLRTGREQHVPDSSHHSLYLMKLSNSNSPEGNCGGNQLLDGSINLSPHSPSTTNDLPVSIATSLHQSLPDFVPFSGMVHHLTVVQTQGNTDTDTGRQTQTHTTQTQTGRHTHKKFINFLLSEMVLAQLPPRWKLRSRIASPRAPLRNQASHVRSRLAAGRVWCRLTFSQVTVLEVTFL